MECPLNTPVGLDEDTGTIHNAYGEIEIRTVYDLRIIDEQQEILKYIVQAINSYEKFKTALEKISETEDEHFHSGCGYSGFIDEIAKQAIEAEKK